MIRRDGSYDTDVREKMRGGEGAVKIEHLWKKDELKGRTRLCARLTLPPGATIGYHKHEDEEEVFYVVSGAGLVEEGDESRKVNAGDTILTGNGAGHAVEAVGDQPLVMLALIVQY
ncbi:MAG: cupin domain-containing protein [Candidatus Pacebacteria bacterium]|nr:cupin domain-containing protein [Candidatus Paceibacterota bacterium]